jgi:hypothetical protein
MTTNQLKMGVEQGRSIHVNRVRRVSRANSQPPKRQTDKYQTMDNVQ